MGRKLIGIRVARKGKESTSFKANYTHGYIGRNGGMEECDYRSLPNPILNN